MVTRMESLGCASVLDMGEIKEACYRKSLSDGVGVTRAI
jgi:hypothetical protein